MVVRREQCAFDFGFVPRLGSEPGQYARRDQVDILQVDCPVEHFDLVGAGQSLSVVG